jgi:hypothetical protein
LSLLKENDGKQRTPHTPFGAVMSNRRKRRRDAKKHGRGRNATVVDLKTYEVVMFEAGVPVFVGAEKTLGEYAVLTAEQLERDILPKVKKKKGVISAWMEGDKLVAKVRGKAPEPESIPAPDSLGASVGAAPQPAQSPPEDPLQKARNRSS